jgi:hypothetical protein
MTDPKTPNVPETPEGEETPRTPFEDFMEHQRRALEETGKALEALLPEGFRTHGSNASKEFTQGFRVLVDAAMDEFKKASKKAEKDAEESDDDGPVSSTGKTKVKVQVE